MNTKHSLTTIALALLSLGSALATDITWVNGSGGNWSNPFNWSPNQVPGSSDTAIVTLAVTVTVDIPVTVNSVIFSNGTLTASSGLIVTGTMEWGFGSLGGTVTIATGAVLNIRPAAYHLLEAGNLTNYGTVAWSGGLVQGRFGTVIHNFGVWDMQLDQTLHSAFGSTVFNNAGTFLKSGGTVMGTIQDSTTFNNTGLLEVRTGILSFLSGGNFTGGTTTNAGGIIQLASGAYTINGTITTTNVQLTSGTLNGMNILRGEFTWVGSDVQNFPGASVTVSSNSVLHIATANNHLMSASTLTNYGTVAWSGGLLQGHSGATVIYNFGVWDAQTDLTLQSFQGSTVFNNAGTFLKSGGTGTGNIRLSTTFNNTGLLEVRTGVLSLQSGGNFTGGTTTNAGGGIIELAGGAYTIDGTVTTTNVQLTSGTLNGMNILRGEFTWVGSDVQNFPGASVTVSSNSVLHIATANNHLMSASTLTNYGTVAWSGGLLQGHSGATVIYNFGVWDAQTDLTLQSFQGSTVFNNAGTFLKSGGTGTGNIRLSTTFNNTGLLEVRTGVLSLQSGGNFTGGTTTNAGGIIELAGGAYTIDGTITTTNVQLTSGTLNGMNILRGELTWIGSNVPNFPDAFVTVASNSVLHIATANNHLMSASALTNYGTVAWSGGLVQGNSGATVIHNFGLWDMQLDQTLQSFQGSTVFNNVGTFLKSGGTGTGNIRLSTTFNHTGLLEVRTGTLSLQSGGTFTGGTTANAGGLIQLAAGEYLIDGTVTTPNVQITDATLANGSVVRGEIAWVSGSTQNLTAPGAVITVWSNSVLHIVTANSHLMRGCTLTNFGTVAWSGGLVQGGGQGGDAPSSSIYNFGLWEAQTDATINSGFGPTFFNNVGMFRKSGGSGTTTLAVDFNNIGTVEAQSGTLAFQGAYAQTGGVIAMGISSLTDYGRIAISGNAPLQSTFRIALRNGYVPNEGVAFPVMTYASRTGVFSHIEGCSIDNGRLFFDAVYQSTQMRLVVKDGRPQFDSSTLIRTNGQFQFRLTSGTHGQTYIIQASTTLTNWISLSTNTAPDCVLEFADPEALNFPYRFYRAILVP